MLNQPLECNQDLHRRRQITAKVNKVYHRIRHSGFNLMCALCHCVKEKREASEVWTDWGTIHYHPNSALSTLDSVWGGSSAFSSSFFLFHFFVFLFIMFFQAWNQPGGRCFRNHLTLFLTLIIFYGTCVLNTPWLSCVPCHGLNYGKKSVDCSC